MQAILTITLLVVFTCSDWLMDIRKKRKSKARDKAQKQAVESISGLERFRQAKDAAKRGATHFSRKLSHSVSRRRPSAHGDRSEELQVINCLGSGIVPSGCDDACMTSCSSALVEALPGMHILCGDS